MEYKIRDIRRAKHYSIDNEVHDDFDLCCTGLTMYNSICRFAKNDTQELFFSVRWFCKKWRVGKRKGLLKFNELVGKQLIKVTGFTQQGSRTLLILDAKAVLESGFIPHRYQPAPTPVSNDTAPVSNSTPNKTDITKRNKQNGDLFPEIEKPVIIVTKEQRLANLKDLIQKNIPKADGRKESFTALQKQTFEYLYIEASGKSRMSWPQRKAARWSKALLEMQANCYEESAGQPSRMWVDSLKAFRVKYINDPFIHKRGFTPDVMADIWPTLIGELSQGQVKKAMHDLEVDSMITSFSKTGDKL